ncbi:MAG: sodium:proton antiporter [Salinibacterium sp.]|nr:sodium:proton antiporter [Salinibacterium sp.]
MTSDSHTDVDPGDGRDETDSERSDRNWSEILQELRVIQTGTQILTGFLLTLAFQPRFAELDAYQEVIYLALVIVAVLATVLALSPVALHRTVFRRKAKGDAVRIGNRLLVATLAAVGLTLTGTSVLIFDVVAGHEAGLIAGAVALAVVATAWIVMPVQIRLRHPRA